MNACVGMLGTMITLVTAVAALITAIAALYSVRQQRKLVAHAVAVDLLWKLEERFEGRSLVAKRRAAAAKLLCEGVTEQNADLDRVIDFFETIGMYMRKKLIDEEWIWHHFSYWAIPYWLVCEKYVRKIQSDYPTIWTEFEYLFGRMQAIEAQKEGRSLEQVIPSDEDV